MNTWIELMAASAPAPSTSKKQHRYNICNIVFDSVEMLSAYSKMEHSEARHPPAGVS